MNAHLITTVTCSAMIAALGLLILKVSLSLRVIARQSRLLSTAHDSETDWAGITIVQPILSGDPLLPQKLRHNPTILPSQTTFLWLIDRADAEGQKIGTEVSRDFPNVQIMLCEPAPDDVNPKVFKLQQALNCCATPFFAVLDDDTTLQPASITAAMIHLQSCELYSGLPRYQDDGRFWSRMLAHFVNNNSIVTYLPLLNFAEPVSINGMFYIVRTESLQQTGGFTPLFHELCDDYAVRRQARKHKWRVVQGITPQVVETSVRNRQHYFAMMHRWMLFATLLIQDQSFLLQSVLTLLLGLPPLLLWISIAGTLLSPGLIPALIAMLVIRQVLLSQLYVRAFRQSGELSPVLSLVSELLQPFHAIQALLNRTITWRTHKIRVQSENRFQILPKEAEKQ